MLEALDEGEALELLHRLGCTDGLPVVIPTAERVERLILASGLPAEASLGVMGPASGAATVEKIAASAVMAGCLPEHMPVVLAGIEAILDPRFDLTEMQATTHCTAPLLLVNGPARQACGPIHSGFGALGPGYRANASIGRALRLAMINIGGGRAGESDMALLGHPGKFTYCLAENEEASPFPPLHVARGFEATASVVTVVGAEAPHSVMSIVDADDPESALRLLRSIAASIAGPGSNNAAVRGGAAVVVLNPDHASLLAAQGYDRSRICAELRELAVYTRAELERYLPARGLPPQSDGPIHCFASTDDILVLVAGGGGLYSMVMPSWCAGPHRNSAVSVAVRLGESCALPG
jgi:hypothetical protein